MALGHLQLLGQDSYWQTIIKLWKSIKMPFEFLYSIVRTTVLQICRSLFLTHLSESAGSNRIQKFCVTQRLSMVNRSISLSRLDIIIQFLPTLWIQIVLHHSKLDIHHNLVYWPAGKMLREKYVVSPLNHLCI